MKYRYCVFVILLLTVTALQAQNRNLQVPTITFDLYWEASTPQNFTVTVDSDGKTKYVSRNPTRTDPDSQEREPDYIMEFTMSSATLDRLFELAKETDYFRGDFDYKQHAIANTGRKTLTYTDPVRHNETTYNWSENKAIEEITRIFQGISNTLEHGQKLQFKRRFDKLGLEKELKGMETLAANKELAEIQVIAPTLEDIANDRTVLNIARQRAKNLLAQGGIKSN